MAARPAGAYVIRDGKVSWQPAVDPTRILSRRLRCSSSGWSPGARPPRWATLARALTALGPEALRPTAPRADQHLRATRRRSAPAGT